MRPSRGKPRAAPAAKVQPPQAPASAKALASVVVEAKKVQELVAECRDDLADVNDRMRKDIDDPLLPPKSTGTLEKSEAVQAKVGTVSDKVAVITDELVEHVRDRRLLDFQFAAALEQEAAARYAAVHDRLTGLPNRALLEDRMEHGLAQAKRHGWGLGVLFIDLDAFKRINDTHGHGAGDRLLVSVAKRLLESSRSEDTVARYGGDEFACLLQEVKSERDAERIAQGMLDAVQRPHDLAVGDQNCEQVVQVSIGIALYPQHGEDAERLLQAADSAMYKAKKSGGGYAFAG